MTDIPDEVITPCIIHAVNDGGVLSIFRLRGVCRKFRDILESILIDGHLLEAAIHRCLYDEIRQHHYGCLKDHTNEIIEYLLKIASEAVTADELCEQLIETAFEIEPVPVLKRMLMEAAAGAACTPKLRKMLHQLEDDDAQNCFGPLSIEPLEMAAVREQVRRVAASIMPRAGRQGINRLNKECAEAVRRLGQYIIAYLDPAAPVMSLILWAGLQWKYTIETAWTKRHCVVQDSLRYLCIRWLLTTASIDPSSDFGAALKFLMAADLTPQAWTAGTALASMITAVQDTRRRAAERPEPCLPRLTNIMIEFWYQHGDYYLPPLIMRASGPELGIKLFNVGSFYCSSLDCGWWRRT